MSQRLILRCEDTLDGIYTALFDAFVYKNRMEKPYEDTISIAIGESGNMELFTQEIPVVTDTVKAHKTMDAIRRKLGFHIHNTLFYALCHFSEERGTVVLGYLVRAFSVGPRISEQLGDFYVMRVLELSRKVSRECEKFYGFIRFRDNGKFLFARFAPKCNVLPMIEEHFSDRFPGENFVIYDENRKLSLVHPMNSESFFVMGNEINPELVLKEDAFESLWKQYFDAMAIQERKNGNCQRNLMPIWYRKHAVEFMKEKETG